MGKGYSSNTLEIPAVDLSTVYTVVNIGGGSEIVVDGGGL